MKFDYKSSNGYMAIGTLTESDKILASSNFSAENLTDILAEMRRGSGVCLTLFQPNGSDCKNPLIALYPSSSYICNEETQEYADEREEHCIILAPTTYYPTSIRSSNEYVIKGILASGSLGFYKDVADDNDDSELSNSAPSKHDLALKALKKYELIIDSLRSDIKSAIKSLSVPDADVYDNYLNIHVDIERLSLVMMKMVHSIIRNEEAKA